MLEEKTYLPEIELTSDERVQLYQTISTPGQAVVMKIFKAVVDGYITRMLNTPDGDKDTVYARFLMTKCAGQLFTLLVNRLNDEVDQYREAAAQNRPQVPIDGTQGILDIGEAPSTYDDLVADADMLEEN
jgi:hypothetical protein